MVPTFHMMVVDEMTKRNHVKVGFFDDVAPVLRSLSKPTIHTTVLYYFFEVLSRTKQWLCPSDQCRDEQDERHWYYFDLKIYSLINFVVVLASSPLFSVPSQVSISHS